MDRILTNLLALHEPEDIVELRSIDPKPTISGYFRADSPNIAAQLRRFPDRTFYQTLNSVNPACYSRGQREVLLPYPKETTSDKDIRGYSWILVDADPVRPSGVSATNVEKEKARQVSREIYRRLKFRGFCDPIVADSGNGYHLLYQCDPKTAANEFSLMRSTYLRLTGRHRAGEVIAYQLRQSFKPGEITPEDANRIGYETASRFLKGKHAFVVATHTDKAHIHNHIILCATTLDCLHGD